MKSSRKKILFITVTMVVVAAVTWLVLYWVLSRTSEQKALRAFNQQRYDVSQKYLRQMQVDDPNNPLLSFNLGVANYQQQKFDDAESDFTRAAAQSEDFAARNMEHRDVGIGLAARSCANAGNSAYQIAQKQIDAKDKEKAIETLERSAGYYRRALEHNPSDERSKQLLKLIEMMLAQLKEQQPQDDKQQGDTHNQQQKQDKKNQPQNQQQRGDQQQESQDQQGQSSEQQQGASQKNRQQGKDNKGQSSKGGSSAQQQKEKQDADGKQQEQPSSDQAASEQSADKERQRELGGQQEQKPLSQEQYDEAIKQLQKQLTQLQKESPKEFEEKREQAMSQQESSEDKQAEEGAEKKEQQTSGQKGTAREAEGSPQQMFMQVVPKESFEARTARLLLDQLDANESALQKRRILVNQANGQRIRQGQKPW